MANLPQGDTPIVSASAGNIGQGLAYAAPRRGRRLIIYATTNANPLKVAAMRRYAGSQEGQPTLRAMELMADYCES